MTTYWVGDLPAAPLTVAPARAPEDYLDLSPFDSVAVELRDPAGALTDSDLTATIVEPDEEDEGAATVVEVAWGETSPFEDPGVYALTLILQADDGVQQRVAPVRLIVQADDGWYSLEEARDDWQGAPDDDNLLHKVLEVSKVAVVEFDAGRLITEDTPRPTVSLREAQLTQARNTYNAMLVAPSGDIEDGALSVTPFPLDWKVKQLIRPESGTKWVG